MGLTKKQANLVLLGIFAAIGIGIFTFKDMLLKGWYTVVFHSEQAMPDERRQAAERLVSFGECISTAKYLEENGTVASIPFLIEGLKRFPDVKPGDTLDGDRRDVVYALEGITGVNAGFNFEDWKQWWQTEGIKHKKEDFPLKPDEKEDGDDDFDIPSASDESSIGTN